MKWLKLFSNKISDGEWLNLDMCQTISFLKCDSNSQKDWEQNGKLYDMFVDFEKTETENEEDDFKFIVTEQEKRKIEKILKGKKIKK